MAASGGMDDFLERFDAHLARQDEIIASIDGHMARQERLEERVVQAFDRNGRAWGHAVSAMSAIRESLDDMRGEIRAQTQAIWRMIDRLDGGPQNA
jgi:hypothetical protein